MRSLWSSCDQQVLLPTALSFSANFYSWIPNVKCFFPFPMSPTCLFFILLTTLLHRATSHFMCRTLFSLLVASFWSCYLDTYRVAEGTLPDSSDSDNSNNTNNHGNVYGAVINDHSHCESSPGSSDESYYHLTVPWRVEGWVDIGTAVKVHNPCPRLYIAPAVAINPPSRSVIWTLVLSHCSLAH